MGLGSITFTLYPLIILSFAFSLTPTFTRTLTAKSGLGAFLIVPIFLGQGEGHSMASWVRLN
ncbi:hypothetical protein D3C71_2210260 [compost metagenome]